MTPAHRFNTLDGMRGIAAIAVMFHHLTQYTSRSIFSNSGLAVDLFFCLSGFVVAFSYTKRLRESMSVREFILRRVIRLYPMFFIGLSLGSLALFWKFLNGQTSLSINQTLTAISLNSLYFPYVSKFYVQVGNGRIPSPIFPTNEPSWSLFFEFSVNVVFGIFAFRAKKIHMLALTLIGMLWLILYTKLTGFSAPGWGAANIAGGIPRTVFGFFSGAFLFMIFENYKRYLPAINPNYIAAFLVVILFKNWGDYIWLGSTLFFIPLLVSIGSMSNPTNSYTKRVFEYLGWISYPVYCLHFPIYLIFTLLTKNSDYGIVSSLVCVPIIIIISHFVAKYIEEPVRKILSNRYLNPKGEVGYITA